MKKWMVETRVTARCVYFVEAEDEKGAEEASCNTSPDQSEDENEETMSITEVVDTDPHGDGKCGCTERCKDRDNCEYDGKIRQ